MKIEIRRNKILSIVGILLLLVLPSIISSAAQVTAASSTVVQSACYLSAQPNPAGVNQPVVIAVWILPLAPVATDLTHGVTITITRPDGTIQTFDNRTTSAGGYDAVVFTPSQVGNHQIQVTYAGEFFKSRNLTYTSSASPAYTLSVLQQPVASYPDMPLPTGYWTRPINEQFRSWGSISQDWLQTAYNSTYSSGTDTVTATNPFSQAPLAPHVMWTAPLADGGGLVGGYQGDRGYYTGNAYEPMITPPLIMNGRLYYNIYKNAQFPGFTSVDLRTGQTYYTNPNYTINFGMEFNYESPNQFGIVGPYLWQTGSTWNMFQAQTGQFLASFANASSGTMMMGNDGTVYVYILNAARHWLAMYNSTRMFSKTGFFTSSISGALAGDFAYGQFRAKTGTYDWSTGIQWNVTIPTYGPAPFDSSLTQNSESVVGITGNSLVCQVGSASESYLQMAYDLTTGRELFAQNASQQSFISNYNAVGAGKLFAFNPVTMQWYAYDASTGTQLWVSTPNVFPWGSFVGRAMVDDADGIMLEMSYDGYVHAINLTNGKEAWKAYSGNSGTETPYGTYPFRYGAIVANGVVFAGTGEHSPNQPLYRGEKLFAINATNGQQIWNMTSWMAIRAIADGYLVGYNQYDNSIYVIGKGPSDISVAAPLTAVPLGTAFTITGKVTDQSTGQKDTPAISDASMANWMQNLKQQIPLNGTVTGVEVTLTAIDPNHNLQNIGTVTSDMYGNYGIMWTPPVPGLYQIIAKFPGSASYGESTTSTYVSVGSAPSTAPIVTPTPTQTTAPTSTPAQTTSPSPSPAIVPPASGIPATTYIAIGAAVVIIVAAAAALVLRKRK